MTLSHTSHNIIISQYKSDSGTTDGGIVEVYGNNVIGFPFRPIPMTSFPVSCTPTAESRGGLA